MSECCTWATVAPTRRRAATTPRALTTFARSTFDRRPASLLRAAVRRHHSRVSRTGSRSTARDASTPLRSPGCRCSATDGELIGEIKLPGAVNFTFGGKAPKCPVHHDRHGGLGRCPERDRAPTPGRQATEGSLNMATIRKRRIIDEAGAEAVIHAAERHASEQGHRVVIAVVDPSGELVALRRTVGAQVASSRVAVDKARTAAIFVRPSREIEQQVSDGRLGALALHGASALTGGIPLTVEGEVVGAIGTSGETPDEDESVSIAGAAADFSTIEVAALTYEGAKQVAEAADHARHAAWRCAGRGGRRRGWRSHLPAATRRGAGREHECVGRQGAHGGDLPSAEQGLRGPGLKGSALGASPGARGAAAGRHADPPRRRGHRCDRRQRRLVGRRGPGAGGDGGERAERLLRRSATKAAERAAA